MCEALPLGCISTHSCNQTVDTEEKGLRGSGGAFGLGLCKLSITQEYIQTGTKTTSTFPIHDE